MARDPGLPQLFKALIGASLKQAGAWFFPRFPYGSSMFMATPHAPVDYAAEVGNGLLSSVVMPVAQYIMRAFPEAPLVVRTLQDDESEIVDRHPLVALVNRPNRYYPGTVLWMATLVDWSWFGESYWRILLQRGGLPGELWWVPPWSIEPKWPSDGSEFISHYEYRPELGTTIRLEVDEVLHFRHGLDPWNPRHGLPPLRAILREIWADREASSWIGALLRNMAIPGMIVSPKGDAVINDADTEVVKTYIMSRFTGEHRGEPMVLGAPTQVDRLSWSPNDMDLSVVRNTAEERVCSALGIPAAVIGFGSGFENSKVGATMHEFVRIAWNNGLIPLQRLLAAELQRVLLPQFEPDTERFQVGWNYDEVQALEQDQNALATRYQGLFEKNLLKRGECRQALGYESDDATDDKYWDEIKAETREAMIPALPPGDPRNAVNGNGNGNGRNGRQAVQQRALQEKQGSLEELVAVQIGRHAGRMDNPPRALLRLAAQLERAQQKLLPSFQSQIVAVLRRYGEHIVVAARELVQKQPNLEDLIRTSIILERSPTVVIRFEMAQIYEDLYNRMAEETVAILGTALDLPAVDMPALQASIRMEARERVRLLDLDNESRQNIASILEQARTEGLDEEAVADMLRTKVPSGRWTTPDIRAGIISRNELRFSANLATAKYAQQQGIGRVLVLDARLGPTDEICEATNGLIVSPAEAQVLASTEHVNGTRGFIPLANQPVAEMVGGVTT